MQSSNLTKIKTICIILTQNMISIKYQKWSNIGIFCLILIKTITQYITIMFSITRILSLHETYHLKTFQNFFLNLCIIARNKVLSKKQYYIDICAFSNHDCLDLNQYIWNIKCSLNRTIHLLTINGILKLQRLILNSNRIWTKKTEISNLNIHYM